jgi:fibronectin type 3 domain-containing protein
MQGHGRGIMNRLVKQARASITMLCLLAMGVMIAGCSGGGGEGVSSQVVSGVAATGAPIAGEAKIKDSSNREKTTVIGSDGFFALDVTDMKGPFILRATGRSDGATHTLYSFADNPGTANINPLTNAAVANAAGVDDPAKIFESPDREKLNKIKDGLSASVAEILDKFKPLLRKFSAENRDPVRGEYKADHNHLDGLFDNVNITLIDGILTITNKKTGAVIFTGKISDIKNGELTDNDDDLPNPGAIPDEPDDVTAVGGNGQVTISWEAVGNATSYNIYWSTVAKVTPDSGTKIAEATSPYVQTGLSTGTKYYYIVTAVNSAGESEASDEESATTTSEPAPTPTVPAAPTQVQATGGTKQVTVTWPAVSGATSYNLYWSVTAGVTKTTGEKIAGATSPTVQNGLSEATTYYYIVTAENSAGEGDPSVQVAAATLSSTSPPTVPLAPTDVTAAGGAKQVTVSWSAVSGASSYNLYWSTTSGVTTSPEMKITGTTSPYVHTGLADSTAYYYIATAQNAAGEGAASAEATATTNAAPPPPSPACGTCHAIPPVLGKHTLHTSANVSCSVCHGSGYSPTTVDSATHINGTIEIAGGIGWNTTARSCSPSCHGSQNW